MGNPATLHRRAQRHIAACEWLVTYLHKYGATPYTKLIEEAQAVGIDTNALIRAGTEMGVLVRVPTWELPASIISALAQD